MGLDKSVNTKFSESNVLGIILNVNTGHTVTRELGILRVHCDKQKGVVEPTDRE